MVNNKKGFAGLWIWVLAMVFLVGIVYLTMTGPFKWIHDKFIGDLTGDELATGNKITKMWNLFPVLFILLAALVLIVGSLRNRGIDQSSGYY